MKGDLHGVVRGLTFLAAFGFTFAAGATAFRLAVQLSAADRDGVAGFLYGLSGFFATPFQKFETVPPLAEAPVVEFSTLLALEAYLLAGLAVTAVLIALGSVIGQRGWLAWDWRLNLEPVSRPLRAADRALARAGTRGDRAVASLARGAWAATSRRWSRQLAIGDHDHLKTA